MVTPELLPRPLVCAEVLGEQGISPLFLSRLQRSSEAVSFSLVFSEHLQSLVWSERQSFLSPQVLCICTQYGLRDSSEFSAVCRFVVLFCITKARWWYLIITYIPLTIETVCKHLCVLPLAWILISCEWNLVDAPVGRREAVFTNFPLQHLAPTICYGGSGGSLEWHGALENTWERGN